MRRDLDHFVPPELRAPFGDSADLFIRPSNAFSLPPMLRNLQPFKESMLLLDGFGNSQFDGGA